MEYFIPLFRKIKGYLTYADDYIINAYNMVFLVCIVMVLLAVACIKGYVQIFCHWPNPNKYGLL